MKRIGYLGLIILSFLFVSNVDAYSLLTRDISNNYGVNKDFKITSYNQDNVLNTPYVSDASEIVYDFADVLTTEEENTIREYANDFKDETNFEVVIYIINDVDAYTLENEGDIAQDFYDYNDFGLNMDDTYSGIMIVMNKLNTGDVTRDGYFQLLSFGNAQFYYDSYRLDRMQDELENYFWTGAYKNTCIKFIDEARTWYNVGSWNTDNEYYLDDDGMLQQRQEFPFLPILGVSLLISFIICVIFVNKNKMVKKAQNASEYIDINDCVFTRRDDLFLTSRTTSYTISSSSGGGGGSGSSRGSSGGGSSRSSGSRR